jgi:hypothetical protein
LLALLTVVLFGVAGCGSDHGSSSPRPTATPAPTATPTPTAHLTFLKTAVFPTLSPDNAYTSYTKGAASSASSMVSAVQRDLVAAPAAAVNTGFLDHWFYLVNGNDLNKSTSNPIALCSHTQRVCPERRAQPVFSMNYGMDGCTASSGGLLNAWDVFVNSGYNVSPGGVGNAFTAGTTKNRAISDRPGLQ